jgi:hypothetical protein
VNWVVISEETIEPTLVKNAFTFDKLIIDGALSASTREKWRTYLRKEDLSFHDVKEEGAFYVAF